MKKFVLFNEFCIISGILFFFLLSVSINAQAIQEWAKKFNNPGNGDDVAVKILADNITGDIYVTGNSYSTGSNYDIVTIKYNKEGTQKWIRTYSGAGNGIDLANDMVFDDLGNIIITGLSTELNSSWDCVTIKYDTFGNNLWIRKYNGSGNGYDYAMNICVDSHGAAVITGISIGYLSHEDIISIKYRSDGTVEWAQRYNGIDNNNDGGYSIAADNEDNIYVTGYCDYLSGGNAVTLKYRSDGNLVWSDIYNTRDDDGGLKILVNDPARQVVTVGKSGTSTVMLCYDFYGEMRWKRAADSRLKELTCAASDNSGNVYLSGITISAGSYDYFLAAHKSSGEYLWSDIYNGPASGFDKPTAIITDNFNNIYITGQSQNLNNFSEYTTLKYSVSGSRLWEVRYGYPRTQYNIPSSISADIYGNILITGYISSSSGTHDFLTVKYNQSTALPKSSGITPLKFNIYQNYPNPFNPSTNIKFDVSKASIVNITVYDMLGREVQILVNEFKEEGTYEINFDASALSSGTYFYKINAGDFTEIKKMMLIK